MAFENHRRCCNEGFFDPQDGSFSGIWGKFLDFRLRIPQNGPTQEYYTPHLYPSYGLWEIGCYTWKVWVGVGWHIHQRPEEKYNTFVGAGGGQLSGQDRKSCCKLNAPGTMCKWRWDMSYVCMYVWYVYNSLTNFLYKIETVGPLYKLILYTAFFRWHSEAC